jgi:hypothetical protein
MEDHPQRQRGARETGGFQLEVALDPEFFKK